MLNPANLADVVGSVIEASEAEVYQAAAVAAAAADGWNAVPPASRAQCLLRAADRMQARMPLVLGLIVREAGKSLPNAIAEVREAIEAYNAAAEERGYVRFSASSSATLARLAKRIADVGIDGWKLALSTIPLAEAMARRTVSELIATGPV